MLSSYIKDLLLNNIKIPYISSSTSDNEKDNSIEKTEVKTEQKSYIRLSNEIFKLNNSSMTFINNDIAYLLDGNNSLYKLHRLNDSKNKYNIVETTNNFIENNNTYIFSLEKEYLFGFNSSEFGKSENSIKLLKTEHNDKNTKIEIKIDETSKKIFNESISKSKEIINDIYLNLISFDENDKNGFLTNYSPITEIPTNNIAFLQYNTYLFIIHPIYKKNPKDKNAENQANNVNAYKDKDYFFSDKYIYAIDQFDIFLNIDKIKDGDTNLLNINYKNSTILKTPLDSISNIIEEAQKNKKSIINIDDIFNNNIKNKNKLLIINNILCFTDTCKNFYDINNNKICYFENESNENALIKDISNDSKENLSNSIISQFDNLIINLTLIKSSINNVQELRENEYKINYLFNNNNIFLKNKNKINEIKENVNKMFLKNKSNILDNNKDDILKEIFQTFDDEETEPGKDEKEKEKEKDSVQNLNEDVSNYILSYLCKNIIEKNDLNEINKNIEKMKKNENPDLYEITKYLKRPYVINIDYPTIKLIEDLIMISSEKNESSVSDKFNIFCLLFILENHLTYLSSLKINSKFLFGNIKNIDYLISLLQQICNKNNEYKNICFSLLIKILSITEDYPNDKLNLLFKEILFPIDFVDNPEKLSFYIEIFKYANYSKANMKTIITNESSYQFILDLINALLTNEKNINISYISDFFNEFILFYNNIISYILVNINGIKFSNFVNSLLRLYNSNLSEEKIKNPKILKPLIYHLIVQCLNNYKLLPNDFYLQNWSYIYDILSILQKIRNNILPNISKDIDSSKNKKDLILDTFNFSADFPGNKYKEIYFGKLSYDKSFEEENKKENENIINTSSTKDEKGSLYIQLLCINKTQNVFNKKTSTNSIVEIINLNNNDNIFSFENILSNNKVEIIYKKIDNIDIINDTIKIRLYPQSINYLIKMRISNYLFYNEDIDILVNPLIELMNKILKKFSFYYTNEENEIFNLFHTRLFSKGVSNKILLTKKENKDEEEIIKYLKENKNNEFNELLETNILNISKNSSENTNEDEKNITKYSKNCLTYLENENIIKCINIFKEKQNIFIKGDIPDKIVNISFLIILKHENLLNKFIDYAEKLIKNNSLFSPDDIFYILFNKCNDLRKTYKEKKDEIIKNEKENEMNEIFDEALNRIYFLFNLNSEGKNTKKDKEKINNNDIINIYIKEHVNNISQIIKNDKFNLSKILDAYRLMQSQAKFREISLIILNNIIQKFVDKQCVDNIIENYYKNFCFPNNANSIKLPNIYESLNSVSENLVLNITNNFNSVINSILDKLSNYKDNNTQNIDTYFDLTIYLNFLLWRIRRRNYPTTNKIFEFFNKSKNPLINDSTKYFFFYNYSQDKKNNSINQFKEFRILDKYATAKILSDIFIYYYQESMIIELEKKIDSSKKPLDSFKLMKGNSILLNDTYNSILMSISSIFNSQFFGVLQLFIDNEKLNNKDNTNNNQLYLNKKSMYNSKLSNLLNEFIKLALSDLDLIFTEYTLWKQLYKLLPYSNYQNTCLIFNLLKKFTNSSFDMFDEVFYDEFNNKYTNEKYYDYLFNIMKDNKYKS